MRELSAKIRGRKPERTSNKRSFLSGLSREQLLPTAKFFQSHNFRSMFYLVLLAARSYGLIEDANFSVTKCNNDNGQPELTFTIDSQYFEDNLSWQADQVDFKMNQIFESDKNFCWQFLTRSVLSIFYSYSWNHEKFTKVLDKYEKTVPEEDLSVRFEPECEYFGS